MTSQPANAPLPCYQVLQRLVTGLFDGAYTVSQMVAFEPKNWSMVLQHAAGSEK
jgi:hypothetical protein